MRDLDIDQIAAVSGGEMSTTSKVAIGAALIVSPVVGLGMMMGYYLNAE